MTGAVVAVVHLQAAPYKNLQKLRKPTPSIRSGPSGRAGNGGSRDYTHKYKKLSMAQTANSIVAPTSS